MKENSRRSVTPSQILALSVLIVILSIIYSLYKNTYDQQIEDYRKEKDHYFRTSIHSPLEDKINFQGLFYFSPDVKYKVKARVTRFDQPEQIEMLSSDGKKVIYLKYGKANFSIDSIPLQLTLFSAQDTNRNNQLFIPFTDKTSGEETYNSGRYLDLPRPPGADIEIDFNKAYHPYCVYSYRYSCPIPPLENFLNISITAGERLEEKK